MSDSAETVAGFHAPVHRSLSDPILLGGAPRTVAIANGTLAAAIALGLRLWIPGLVLWAVGHAARGLGRASAMRSSSTWCAVTCATPPISDREEASDDESRRIPQAPCPARRLSAVGGVGRQRRRAQQGWQLSKNGALSRSRSRFRNDGRVGAATARLNNALERFGSGWAIFVEAERQPSRDYPAAVFSGSPISWLVDEERREAFEREGSHYETDLLF